LSLRGFGSRTLLYVRNRLLCAGTIEEKIYQRQLAKQGLSGAMMDKSTPSTHDLRSQFTLDELRDLFTVRENVACDTHDLISCNCLRRSHDDNPAPMDMDGCEVGCEGSALPHARPAQQQLMHHLLSWQVRARAPASALRYDDAHGRVQSRGPWTDASLYSMPHNSTTTRHWPIRDFQTRW